MRDLIDPNPATLREPTRRSLLRSALVATLGFGLYGATVGFWRSPAMAAYVAFKMPLLVAATLACNGFLNGLFGLLLGSGLGFRSSLQALLSGFAISGLVLGSLAPVTLFLALNAPPADSTQAAGAHASFLVSHTALIAVAGLCGLARLRGLLTRCCPTPAVAHATFAAWLAGNALLGAQFSWILRPFFGSPGLGVAFLRDRPLEGNFYEALWSSARRLPLPEGSGTVALLLGTLLLVLALRDPRPSPSTP